MSVSENDEQGVPIIDLDLNPSPNAAGASSEVAVDALARQLEQAMRISGFFYVRNHAIAESVLSALVAQTQALFVAPEAVRQAIAIDRNNRGYLARGEARMLGARHNDLKEVFFFGRDLKPDDPDIVAGRALCAVNQWPDGLPGFRDATVDYLVGAAETGQALLRGFARVLGKEASFFESRYQRPMARGQLIHYPAPAPDASPNQFGVAPHTDFGCITLLYQHTPGLEVLGLNGQWLSVPPIASTLVVNIGDLLERWSDARLPSTRHRVRNMTGASRYSIAIFFDPDPDAIVDPVDFGVNAGRFEPITAADYILSRSQRVFAQFDDSIRNTPE